MTVLYNISLVDNEYVHCFVHQWIELFQIYKMIPHVHMEAKGGARMTKISVCYGKMTRKHLN